MRNKCSQLRPSPVQASPDCPHNTSILLYSSQKPYLNLESVIRLLARPKTKNKKKAKLTMTRTERPHMITYTIQIVLEGPHLSPWIKRSIRPHLPSTSY